MFRGFEELDYVGCGGLVGLEEGGGKGCKGVPCFVQFKLFRRDLVLEVCDHRYHLRYIPM